jgi:hypothetical protein
MPLKRVFLNKCIAISEKLDFCVKQKALFYVFILNILKLRMRVNNKISRQVDELASKQV